MNYTYTIRVAEPKRKLLSVVYQAPGYPDYIKVFRTSDFTTAGVDARIAAFAPNVRKFWEGYVDTPPTGEIEEGATGSGTAILTIEDPIPEYDENLQRIERVETFNAETQVNEVSYTIVSLTDDEIALRKAEQSQADTQDPAKQAEAINLLVRKNIVLNDLDDSELAQIVSTFQAWGPDQAVAIDDIRSYAGELWLCIQAHTTQLSWSPDRVPALWVRYRDPAAGPGPWSLGGGTGVSGSYNLGDQVTHDNPNDGGAIWVYTSAIPANTTEPGRDGTFDRYWTPENPV